jgi:hypothetical protein
MGCDALGFFAASRNAAGSPGAPGLEGTGPFGPESACQWVGKCANILSSRLGDSPASPRVLGPGAVPSQKGAVVAGSIPVTHPAALSMGLRALRIPSPAQRSLIAAEPAPSGDQGGPTTWPKEPS